MLSPFPDLIALSFLAPTMLRLALGVWMILSGYRHLTHRAELRAVLTSRFGTLGNVALWPFTIMEFALGAMLVTGLYTQIAALLTGTYALKLLYFRRKTPGLARESSWFYILVLALSLSLLLTGAGAFAIDLPL